MPLSFQGAFPLPGIGSTLQTTENIVWWGLNEQQKVVGAVIDGSARDASNDPTSVLRAGLLLGKITATGKLKNWNPEATDGTQRIFGVLLYDQRMTDQGTDRDRWFGYVMVGGNVKSAALIVPTTIALGVVTVNGALSSTGKYANLARAQMSNQFTFDDEPWGNNIGKWEKTEIVTGNRTVTAADTGTLFINYGAANTYTLPAPVAGLHFGFFESSAHAMTIAPASGTMVTPGDAVDASLTTAGTTGVYVEVLGVAGLTTGLAKYVTLPSAGVITTINAGALEAVTAAGSTYADAGAVTSGTTVVLVTCDSTSKGVVLPAATAVGQRITLRGGASAAHLYLLNNTATINGTAGQTGISLAATKTFDAICTTLANGGSWITCPITAS